MSGIVGRNAGRDSGVVGSVDSSVGADAITGDELADNACDSEHYTDGSIDTIHIANDQITLALMAGGTDGQILTYDASGDPVAVGPGTDGQVLTSTGAGSPPAFEGLPAGGAQVYVGTLTRGQATATGDVTYTGVGFQPKALIFHVYVGNGGYDQACFGFDDGTRAYAVSPLDYNSANAWYGDGTNSIWPPESASARQIGKVSSFTSDGFVFAWTKAGSPAATSLIVFYTAIG